MAGPFYFAWVAPSETVFDPAVHNREDEDVFGFTVEHTEGDFAGLEIEIRNPRVGLLAPARKVHAFLSYDTGTEIKPLFRGRLIGRCSASARNMCRRLRSGTACPGRTCRRSDPSGN